jgi:hypothetical protein
MEAIFAVKQAGRAHRMRAAGGVILLAGFFMAGCQSDAQLKAAQAKADKEKAAEANERMAQAIPPPAPNQYPPTVYVGGPLPLGAPPPPHP